MGEVGRGRYLCGSRGCVDCHGENAGGATAVGDGKGLKLAGPNTTAGNPRLAACKPVDWVHSIRHGVGTDGRALRLMPSEGSVPPRYASADAFVAMMRSGKRADGSSIGVMPFASLKTMSDVDLRALHLYLQGLAAR